MLKIALKIYSLNGKLNFPSTAENKDEVYFVTLMCFDSLQDVSKRMSLPMDIRLPPEFLKKLQLESDNSPLCKPLSRMSRRASLVSTLLYTTTTGLCMDPSVRMPQPFSPRLDVNKQPSNLFVCLSVCLSVRLLWSIFHL